MTDTIAVTIIWTIFAIMLIGPILALIVSTILAKRNVRRADEMYKKCIVTPWVDLSDKEQLYFAKSVFYILDAIAHDNTKATKYKSSTTDMPPEFKKVQRFVQNCFELDNILLV